MNKPVEKGGKGPAAVDKAVPERTAPRREFGKPLEGSPVAAMAGRREESDCPFKMIEFSADGVLIVAKDGKEKKIGFQGVDRVGENLVAATKTLLPNGQGGVIVEYRLAIDSD